MNLLEKAKELFDKVKPILMSEEKNNGADAVTGTEEIKETATEEVPAVIPVVTDDSTPGPPLTPWNIITALFNGAGVGLLLGVLLGLAISPVVSGIIGTLSGLLAVLLGINEKYISPLKGVRIGAFGFFCVAGIFTGMYIRTNNGLLPSRTKMMEEYTKVGYTQQEARDFIAFREFGLAPAGWTGASASNSGSDSSGESSSETSATSGKAFTARKFVNPNETGAERKSLLYSSEIDASACYVLDNASISQPTSEIKNTFEEAGGTWKEMAQNLGAGVPDKVFAQALLTMRDCFCAGGASGILKITNCETVGKINSSQSLDQIKKTLSASGETWKTIVDKIGKDIPSEYQKTIFLSLIKILCHD